jgi:hypothetical protein
MKEEQFTPINEEVKIKPAIINLPETQKKPQYEEKNTDIVKLPSWNIEPPIEIKRGK